MQRKLSIAVVGLGRMGQIYVRDIRERLPQAQLMAVVDIDTAKCQDCAERWEVPKRATDAAMVLDDPDIEAVVIATPTQTHRDLVLAAAQQRKAIFCEKPLALSWADAGLMETTIQAAGVFFHMGFMRRFDSGYRAAKEALANGGVGNVLLFKATSRDPFPPELTYLDRDSSGGLIVDAGIHDFDLARWYMGEVKSVTALGGVLAYPEFRKIGDVDNAIITVEFENGSLGVIDLSRTAGYGYDITTEILGTKSTLRIGRLRETPLTVFTRNAVAHDTVPGFAERFAEAYHVQLQDFVDRVIAGKPPSISIHDGVAALRVALAAVASLQTRQSIAVQSICE